MDSATITQLFVLYGLLVVAVVGSLTIIILRLPRAGRDLAATQSHLTAIREQLDEFEQRFDRVDNNTGVVFNRVNNLPGHMNEEMQRHADLVMQALVHHNHADGTGPLFTAPREVEATDSEHPPTEPSEMQ